MSPKRSGPGSPIIRHEEWAEPQISGGDPRLIEAIEAHVTEHFGAPTAVWHQIVSLYVHVDVHVVEPTPERPVYTLVTSGMSERPMRSADGDRYAELMMVLPPTWPSDARWPFTLLQDLAELPHGFDTTLWTGHTVPHGDPPKPYAPETKLCGALLMPPLLAPEGFETLVHDDREIRFFAVIPLHRDEMQLKLDQGLDPLLDLLDDAEVTEILDADRPSVAPARRRRLFGRGGR
jgi:Suppressor of fused protein (SUFU)